jgi:hypothetical protein
MYNLKYNNTNNFATAGSNENTAKARLTAVLPKLAEKETLSQAGYVHIGQLGKQHLLKKVCAYCQFEVWETSYENKYNEILFKHLSLKYLREADEADLKHFSNCFKSNI